LLGYDKVQECQRYLKLLKNGFNGTAG